MWFSNIGLLGAALALWLENRLLASMMLLATFMADGVAWNVDFLFGLLVGWHPLGATTYMFDERIPMFIRGMSFSHLVVPALLTWIVYKLRYDTRALAAQTLFSCIVLLLSYTLTDPASNINWVFGVGAQPQTYMPGWLYLAVVMMYVPVGFYLPIHLLLWKLGWHRIRQNKPARTSL